MANVPRSVSPSKFTHQQNLLRIRDRSSHPAQVNLFSMAVDLRKPNSRSVPRQQRHSKHVKGKDSMNVTQTATIRTGYTSVNSTFADLRQDTGSRQSSKQGARVKIVQEKGILDGSWTDLIGGNNQTTVIKFNLRNPRQSHDIVLGQQRSGVVVRNSQQSRRMHEPKLPEIVRTDQEASQHSLRREGSVRAGILRQSLDTEEAMLIQKNLHPHSGAEHQLSIKKHMDRVIQKHLPSKSLETSRTAWMHGPGPHQRSRENQERTHGTSSESCERYRIRGSLDRKPQRSVRNQTVERDREIFRHVLAQQEGNPILFPQLDVHSDLPEGETFETDENFNPSPNKSLPLVIMGDQTPDPESPKPGEYKDKAGKPTTEQKPFEILGEFLSKPVGSVMRSRENSRSPKKSKQRGFQFNKIMETSEEKSSGVEPGEQSLERSKSSQPGDSKDKQVSSDPPYPIPLPSAVVELQEREMKYKFTEFTAKYKQSLDNFVYEFFVREDGMLKCLRDGVPYLTPQQKQELDAIEENKRLQIQEIARVIFELEELPPMELTKEAERFIQVVMGTQAKNKLLPLADEEFQTLIPRLLRVEENTLKAMEGQSFKVDMRTGVSRYKNTLLPNELNEIEAFFDREDRIITHDDDVQLIDQIVSRLEFFRKIDQGARYSLLREATLRKYNPEEFVVQQGEHGNSMFVILFGAANVLINGVHPKTKLPHKFIVASLVDGSSFGEYSLLSFPTPTTFTSTISMDINELKSTLNTKGIKKILEVQRREHHLRRTEDIQEIERIGTMKMRALVDERQKSNFKEVVNSLKPVFVPNTRAASVQVYESAYMLEVSAELFKRAIVDKIREEMIEKIRLLSLQTYFAGHTNLNFVPIAMLMKKVDFKLGQTLIKKGETPSSLYIIKSGSVEVVNIMSRSREVNPKIYKNFIRRPLRSFNFEFQSSHGVDITTKQRQQEATRIKKEQQEEDRKANMQGNTRLFVFDPVMGERTKSGFRKYYDFFVTKRLMTGDSLFTRCLHSKDISGDGNILIGVNPGIEKAKLSVIAASANVECYELKKNLIVFIPQPAKGILLAEVQKQPDHDVAIDTDTMSNIEFWDEFKEQEYISQMLEKQITKNVDMYKKF